MGRQTDAQTRPAGRTIPLVLSGLINPLFAALAMASSSLGVVGNSAHPLPVANS